MDRVPSLLSIASGFIPDSVKANRTSFDRLRTLATRSSLNDKRLLYNCCYCWAHEPVRLFPACFLGGVRGGRNVWRQL
ncbi:MAG: hypothetical protein ACO1PI_08730 [Bacteroidota bacterium]